MKTPGGMKLEAMSQENDKVLTSLLPSGLTFSEILESVQASEEEILAGLEELECVEVEGLWYVLDQDYQMMVLSRILK